MHTLITDVVESQGGSTLLVRMLNRIGVCASADTLSRFIQHKVSTCDEDGMKYLTPDTFTVVSADNIDFMHSFARIFCGRQTSSWHGTTVKVAQPIPSLSLPEVRHSTLPRGTYPGIPTLVTLTYTGIPTSWTHTLVAHSGPPRGSPTLVALSMIHTEVPTSWIHTLSKTHPPRGSHTSGSLNDPPRGSHTSRSSLTYPGFPH